MYNWYGSGLAFGQKILPEFDYHNKRVQNWKCGRRNRKTYQGVFRCKNGSVSGDAQWKVKTAEWFENMALLKLNQATHMYYFSDVKVHIFWEGHKFCEIFPLLLTTVHTVKSEGKISKNVVAFSEYMNFNDLVQWI